MTSQEDALPKFDAASPEGLIACPDCDLLLRDVTTGHGQKSRCPRCGSTLRLPKTHSIERTLALSLSGLILYWPAMFLPLMTLSTLGLKQSGNLIQGIHELFGAGFHLVAILVLLTGVLVPFVKLGLLFCTSLSLRTGIRCPGLARMFRAYTSLDQWGMLEVYMLGILIAVFKLQDLASVAFGTGLYCFVLLLILTLFSSAALDHEIFWQRIDQIRRPPA
jgi:paraquat-inducible protein A